MNYFGELEKSLEEANERISELEKSLEEANARADGLASALQCQERVRVLEAREKKLLEIVRKHGKNHITIQLVEEVLQS